MERHKQQESGLIELRISFENQTKFSGNNEQRSIIISNTQVSFDITTLFNNSPWNGSLRIIEQNLESDIFCRAKHFYKHQHEDVVFSFKTIYFKFENNVHNQNFVIFYVTLPMILKPYSNSVKSKDRKYEVMSTKYSQFDSIILVISTYFWIIARVRKFSEKLEVFFSCYIRYTTKINFPSNQNS